MKKRKICVVTGTRAEYGLLYWLMKEIQNDPELLLQIVATGMHLSPEFGLTYTVIENDGFAIDEKVEMLLSSDTPVGITKSLGLGVIGFADAFDRLRPDIVVLLGDRYEALAAAEAAMVARIPLAHISGGERTEGAIDEAIRHSITKMAFVHFPANEVYRKRIIQLGEQPDRVFNVGDVGLENIDRLPLLNKIEFEKSVDFKLGAVNFLVTYHPVTLGKQQSIAIFKNVLEALAYFKDAKIIFTKGNSDMCGRDINFLIDKFVEEHSNAKAFVSLGQIRYLSALKHMDVVIGNSSSGIVEAPYLKKATVNIGERQDGRLKATSIIDCSNETSAIAAAIKKALSVDFKIALADTKSLYGSGCSAKSIKTTLKKINIGDVLRKKFYDINIM